MSASQGDPWGAPPPPSMVPSPPGGDRAVQTSAGRTALAISCVSLVVSAALLLLARREPWASLVAWLLAGPVSITAVGVFLGAQTRSRATAVVYRASTFERPLYVGIVIASLVLCVLAAWNFADWAGRQ